MSNTAIEAARMMDMLPDEDKTFAYEFIKKLVKAWDPDFTKVTPEEAQRIKAAEESGFVVDSDIDWDNSVPSCNEAIQQKTGIVQPTMPVFL